jgi:hypothetical protein
MAENIFEQGLEEIKKTIVFLGDIRDKKTQLYATGFLVRIQNIYHLITAKHVVIDRETGKIKDGNMHVFFNLKSGGIGKRTILGIKDGFNVDWVFHKNDEIDIAVIPFGLNHEKDDVKVIPEDLFLLPDRLFELYDVFFLSYQPGIELRDKVSPIFRSGTISIINEDKTFFVDASAFPGNSGSPVFLKPSPIRFDEEGISIGGDQLGGKFIGIIGEYIPYTEVAISIQTGRPRVVFEENTGLSKVWTVGFVKEIIESDVFHRQLNKLAPKEGGAV